MTKADAVRQFKELHNDLYIDRVDYWTAQLAWTCYIDNLCRDGQITMKQFETWSTPLTYGKRLRPTRKQLERRVYL